MTVGRRKSLNRLALRILSAVLSAGLMPALSAGAVETALISVCSALELGPGDGSPQGVRLQGRLVKFTSPDAFALVDSSCVLPQGANLDSIPAIALGQPNEETKDEALERMDEFLSAREKMQYAWLSVEGVLHRVGSSDSLPPVLGNRLFWVSLERWEIKEITYEELPTVEICSLFDSTKTFEKKLIAIKALYSRGMHGGLLFGPCDEAHRTASAIYPRFLRTELSALSVEQKVVGKIPYPESISSDQAAPQRVWQGLFVGRVVLDNEPPPHCVEPDDYGLGESYMGKSGQAQFRSVVILPRAHKVLRFRSVAALGQMVASSQHRAGRQKRSIKSMT